jgi:predicted DNA-binding transcriptional regulator AlpA
MTNAKKAPAAQVVCVNDGGGVIRLISKPEVLDRVGVTYPTLWSWMREGKFPRSRQLGGKAAWVEAEIEEWIKDLPVRRLKGDAVQKVA